MKICGEPKEETATHTGMKRKFCKPNASTHAALIAIAQVECHLFPASSDLCTPRVQAGIQETIEVTMNEEDSAIKAGDEKSNVVVDSR